MAGPCALWLLLLAIAWNAPDSHAQECGMSPVMNRVVGGMDAAQGSWPWQVSIFLTRGGNSFHTCGGTLINQQWVLTAAHCIQSSAVTAFAVFLGRHTQTGPNPNEVRRTVTRIIAHPNYNVSSFHNDDLALMLLNSPVTFTDYIRPICLAAMQSVILNPSCVLTGWGRLTSNVSSTATLISNTLQQISIPVVDSAQCQSQYQAISPSFVITSAMICAGQLNRGICQGDSGSPLVCQQDSVWVQVGIVSFGTICATGPPDVYTRVPVFQQWITDQVARGGGSAGVTNVGFVAFGVDNNSSTSLVASADVHHSTLFYLLLFPLLALLG